MRYVALAAALVSALAGSTTGPVARPRQDRLLQKAVAHGVRVAVSVTDGGRAVVGLGPDDFEVFDNDVPQRIETAGVVGRVALGLVLDSTLSVRPVNYEPVLAAAGTLIEGLQPGDQASIVAFSDRVVSLVPLTGDQDALRRGIRQVENLSAGLIPRSVVWDAVFGTASLLQGQSAHPLVVLFSDGMDNASWLKRPQVEDALRRLGVPVDFVALPFDMRSSDLFPPGLQVPETLASETGGIDLKIDDRNLSRKLGSHLDQLRQAYVVTYTPNGITMGDGWHTLRIRVKGRRAVVRARSGYYSSEGTHESGQRDRE